MNLFNVNLEHLGCHLKFRLDFENFYKNECKENMQIPEIIYNSEYNQNDSRVHIVQLICRKKKQKILVIILVMKMNTIWAVYFPVRSHRQIVPSSHTQIKIFPLRENVVCRIGDAHFGCASVVARISVGSGVLMSQRNTLPH